MTLFGLLISTGLGSFASERASRSRAALLGRAAALAALVLVYRWGLGPIVDRGAGWPFPARGGVTLALLFPLGLCLGTLIPLGLRAVAALSEHGEAFVAWGWAVNGFFLAGIVALVSVPTGAAAFATGAAAHYKARDGGAGAPGT